MKRSHYLNELRAADVDSTVSLSGFVHRRRDHGGLIFIDLRDRYGVTQITFDPDSSVKAHELANELRSEFVIHIKGTVAKRPEGMQNKELATGDIEVVVTDLDILSRAITPPFEIDSHVEPGEDVRLKYRYLDLRRERLQKNLILRHEVIRDIRKKMNNHIILSKNINIFIKSLFKMSIIISL